MDLYCERIGPGFWAEPVNASSNLAFLAAAWAAWSLARRRQVESGGLWVLIALCVSIGLGSGAFHTFATRWASLLDVIPILLFQLAYIWLYFHRIARMRGRYVAEILVIFLALTLEGTQFPQLLNGSFMYLPALLFLLGMGVHHWIAHRVEPALLLVASGVLVVSLTLRTIDNIVCPAFPLGTHFLWHILNGALMYLLLRGFIVNLVPAREARHPGTEQAVL
jgi:hypothetical protein